MAYFVRVSVPYTTVQECLEALPAEVLVVYEHEASQVHCHFYIKTHLKTDSIKVRLKKFHNFTKDQWSFKTAKDDLCVRYMAKGKYDPKYVRGFPKEKIDEYKSDWKSDVGKKPKTITVYDIAEEVSRQLRISEMTSEEELYKQAIHEAIATHHRMRKAFCEFSIAKVVETAVAMYAHGCISLERRLLLKFNRDR